MTAFAMFLALLQGGAVSNGRPDWGWFTPSNWGKIQSCPKGEKFIIFDHPKWTAVGHRRADGKFFILWTETASGLPCPGVYVFRHGRLRGHWGYSTDVYVDGNGELQGELRRDEIRRLDRHD